jgi:myo-inositol-1(or 4)-monophosphatase
VPTLTDAELAITAASAGAAEVRERYGGPLERHAKEGTDFATSADLASEEAIRKVLAEHRPYDAMLGEEGGRTGPLDAERQWLVDPLCGTENFAARTPLVAVNVAVREGELVLAAASADPFSDEVFWSDGSTAFVRREGRDEPLVPSGTTRLVDGDGLRLFGNPRVSRDFSPRVTSSTLTLSWLAAGRRAAYVHEGDLRDNVHFAAPIAIAQAAGCVVTGLQGQPLHTGAGGLLAAADVTTHIRILELLTSSAAD